jgi:DNA repair exonuclease SbcCD ATPase subunit
MTLNDLEKKIAVAESKLQHLEGQKEAINKQYEDNLAIIRDNEIKSDIFLKASTLLQLVSEKTRERSIEKMEAIVTQAIQEVYGDKALRFKIVFENKRNAVAVEFKLWDENLKQFLNIIRCEAGGIKNIIAAILRLVVIDLYNPKIEGPVILDEIGVHISQEHRARFGKFLQQYSELTGRQIILVSHLEKVNEYADKKIRLHRIDTNCEIEYNG